MEILLPLIMVGFYLVFVMSIDRKTKRVQNTLKRIKRNSIERK